MIATFLDIAIALSAAMVTAAVAMVAWRMIRGPLLPDRIVALDMLGLAVASVAGLAALIVGHTALLDVALGVSILSFLGTIAFAAFIERTFGAGA